MITSLIPTKIEDDLSLAGWILSRHPRLDLAPIWHERHCCWDSNSSRVETVKHGVFSCYWMKLWTKLKLKQFVMEVSEVSRFISYWFLFRWRSGFLTATRQSIHARTGAIVIHCRYIFWFLLTERMIPESLTLHMSQWVFPCFPTIPTFPETPRWRG